MSNEQEKWNDLSFHGKTAVVTGAARGIGRAIAYRLAGLGAKTVLWDRDGDVTEQSARELRDKLQSQGRPAKVEWVEVDVSQKQMVKEAMKVTARDKLDILVNSAAINPGTGISELSEEMWDKTLQVNLTGIMYCCQVAIPYLENSESPAIVNISSSTAITGGVGVNYAASKAGIDGLTRHLAVELAPKIRVNSIQPRSINSDGFRAYLNRTAEEPEAVVDQIIQKVPLGRLGKPSDIGDLVAFLASDWASYITGQIILIDGGRTFQ